MRTVGRRALLRGVGLATAAAVAGCTKGPEPVARPTGPTVSPTPSAGLSAAPSTVSAPDWTGLAHALTGHLVRPGQSGYAPAARLYNPRFDAVSRPAAVAQCVTADDVAACVRFAARSHVPIAMRSGGHSYGGWSTGPGLVADVSGLKSVTVDKAAGLARIGAGAKLADVYAALGTHGVAVAGGSCPTVGITGLALGGGLGVLNRAFGLTCDAIRAVEIVTADGVRRNADDDLLWALRGGGGGSFGAVTELTLAVRPAPTVNTYYLAWDLSAGAEVVAAWQRWIARADDRLWSTCKLLAAPGTGRRRALVAGTWIGPSSALDAQLKPLLTGLPAPAADTRHTYDYARAMLFEAGCSTSGTAAACIADGLGKGREAFAATSSVVDSPLPAPAIEAAVAYASQAMGIPGLIEGGVSLDALGGAAGRVAPDATAFPHRRSLAIAQYTATYEHASAEPFDAYVRGFRLKLRPWCGDWAYANYADPSIADHGTAYWRGNLERLRSVKRAVDPGNLFTFPQAVTPAA
ncbi:FAD-binding oxidoreductase [Hamadaea tsunoensis]|uniref:FAD-binding oxidoreductase n=1 Tax=Hamadaea tsunoensis TaxID=53368 RepID=UPI00054DC4B1|nr:FAD-binding oxidoreductase [Hamadaea tsunoensis]